MKGTESLRKISWGEVFAIVSVTLSVGAWSLTRIDRKFDEFDKKFDHVSSVLERIERDNRDFHGRLSFMEGKK
jgi:hypothetical protein